jgi:DNA-binding Lrp family transcriptional regulator
MPFKLDRVDTDILRVMMEDARRSYRQISKITGVSTPTVESRIRRMMETGLIKKIVPSFDPDKVLEGITALITFRVEDISLEATALKLSELDEVRSIFLTTGESNLMLRIILKDSRDLQDFISSRVKEFGNIQVLSSQIITQTIKDEQGIIIKEDMGLSLKCDYCKGDIATTPFKLKVGQGERYFCCKTCQSAYKEKYKSRIESLSNVV